MTTPKDSTAFTDAMADILRLPDETLAMAYIYLQKYTRFLQTSSTTSPLDTYTLALATLSLAAKSTESARPPSAILLPAHRLLHPSATPALSTSSPTYLPLRQTLLSAELLLLRALAFSLHLPSPLHYLERYLAKALDPIATSEARNREQHDYARWSRDEKAEWGVVELMETGLGREVKTEAVRACKSYELVCFWPARAVGLGVLWRGMEKRGWLMGEGEDRWVERVGGGKVDLEDWRSVVGILGSLPG